MPRVVHFEIHAEDPERAIHFYSELFDWKFSRFGEMEYWLITTGDDGTPGINGGLFKRMGPNPPAVEHLPVTAFVCTVDVESLDAYVEKALAQGAVIAVPKMAVQGIGWLAYLKDCEGNLIGLMQNDSAAA